MIHVQFDLSRATPEEIEAFFALPKVSGAMDVLSQTQGDELAVQFDLPSSIDALFETETADPVSL